MRALSLAPFVALLAGVLLPLAVAPEDARAGETRHGVLGAVIPGEGAVVVSEPAPILGDLLYSVPAASVPQPAYLRGLSLDLEACLNGGCVHASDGTPSEPARVVLQHGDAGPVRVRLHLDCANLAELRGIAAVARVVLVRANQPTLHCAREPRDAYCEFRYWQGETRWDEELVTDFFPRSADTAWPDPEGRVDEAEVTLLLDSDIPTGEYDLVAALPKELVDQYPCEEVRNHQWVESPPLRVALVERSEPVRWQSALVALHDAAKAEDVEGMRTAIGSLVDLAWSAPEGVLPMTGVQADVRAESARLIIEAALAPAPPEIETSEDAAAAAAAAAFGARADERPTLLDAWRAFAER